MAKLQNKISEWQEEINELKNEVETDQIKKRIEYYEKRIFKILRFLNFSFVKLEQFFSSRTIYSFEITLFFWNNFILLE